MTFVSQIRVGCEFWILTCNFIRKILDILDKSDRLRFSMLFLAILTLGFLEVIGIASILPFMELLSKEDALAESRFLRNIYDYFAFNSQREFLLIAGGFVLFLITLSSILSIVTNYIQYKISWSIAHKKSMQLLSLYLKKPYSFFLKSNTSELRAYLVSEVGNLVGGIITPLLEFISRSIVSLTILGLLLFISPNVTVRVFIVLGGAYLIIYASRQRYLKRLGKERIKHNVDRYKFLEEMLTGIKTLKIYGAQEYFYKRYENSSEGFSDVQPKVKMVYATPKYLLEMLAFGGILAITLLEYMEHGDIKEFLPRLTLYAVAGYKLLPALQQSFAAISKVKHSLPSLEVLYDDLVISKYESKPIFRSDEVLKYDKHIKISNLYFAYESSDKTVLNDLNLTIDKGSTVAFVGFTGSGKTTLIDIVSGLLDANSGNLIIDDQSLTKESISAWQNNIAYVPQEVFLYDDSIKANVTLGDAQVDIQKLDEALKMSEIHDFIYNSLPQGIETKIGERGVRLSGGQRQRLGLARALYRNPEVLILDEATSALDNITEKSIISSINSLPESLTVIIIAHRLSTVKFADNIFILEDGKIIQSGKYSELLEKNALFKKLVELS